MKYLLQLPYKLSYSLMGPDFLSIIQLGDHIIASQQHLTVFNYESEHFMVNGSIGHFPWKECSLVPAVDDRSSCISWILERTKHG